MSTTNLENIKRTPTLSCCLHQTQRWSCENIESYFFVVGLIHYFYITRQSREREREKSTTKVTQIFNPPAVHKIKRKETNRWKWWKLLFFLCKLSFNNLWWTELGFLLLCTFWHLCLLVFERIHPSTRARVSCQVFFFLGRLLKAEKKKIKGMRQLETVMGPWSFSHFLVDSLGAAWLWCLFPVPVLPPRSCDIRVNVIGPIDSEKASRLFSFQVDNGNFFKIILKKGILLSLVDPLLSFQVESKW